MRSLFQLDPEITFLNHGSFGACPKSVFAVYQEWQRRLEAEPVHFFQTQFDPAITYARSTLGKFIGCSSKDLVFFPNPTTALNAVIRSLPLSPDTHILSTDHEYGALDRTWKYYCKKSGARYIRQKISLPITSDEQFLSQFLAGVTSKTRYIFISHMTSMTATTFPVEDVCSFARENDIICIIDGAHIPGHIELNIAGINPHIYSGACHKWMCAPKGSSFLYASSEVQDKIDPLVVSWGWESDFPGESRFIDYHQWQGTRDMSAFLTVPAAIDFLQSNEWLEKSRICHDLAVNTAQSVNEITGMAPIVSYSPNRIGQMIAMRLPVDEPLAFSRMLFEKYKIEIPAFTWNDQALIRISVQMYNTEDDCARLLDALKKEL